MDKEIEFKKYTKIGAGYHWKQISNHLYEYNAYVDARYKKVVGLCKKYMDPAKDIPAKELMYWTWAVATGYFLIFCIKKVIRFMG